MKLTVAEMKTELTVTFELPRVPRTIWTEINSIKIEEGRYNYLLYKREMNKNAFSNYTETKHKQHRFE